MSLFKIHRDGDLLMIENVDDDGNPLDPPQKITLTMPTIPTFFLKLYRALDRDGMYAPLIETMFARFHRQREHDRRNPPPPWQK